MRHHEKGLSSLREGRKQILGGGGGGGGGKSQLTVTFSTICQRRGQSFKPARK